ncbi:Protein argonaute 1-like [Lasiodiplodia theobromae]|uniref:Protein argonaute 1-like n=1 Tax=Lasiodiplodia theobromae TaxID=45133 RepID=UPI0015C2D7B2|nr:Protein argonaute 1-like [Lasiodiplodia theobromae]KAF4546277.1 Protein argonaute 1-like [Lasiodiplodia theobromae]
MEAMTVQSSGCYRCKGDHEWKQCREQVTLEGPSESLAWPSESRYGRFQREKKFAVWVENGRKEDTKEKSSEQAGEGSSDQAGEGSSQQAGEGSSKQAGEEHAAFLEDGQLAEFNAFFQPTTSLPDRQGYAGSNSIDTKHVDTSGQAVTQGNINFDLRPGDDNIYALRPAFSGSQDQKTVLTNHFTVKLRHKRIFWYEFSGTAFENQMARGKKKDLIERFIRDTDTLNNNRNLFATDYKHVLVSWVDLRRENAGDQVGEVDVSVEPKEGEQRDSKFVELCLIHTLDLDAFKNQANGTAAPSEVNSNLVVQALNILISKNATEYPDEDFESFQIGTNRFFRKAGWEDLRKRGRDTSTSLLVCHRGYFSTIKPAMENILLNLNTAMSVFFRPMKLSDFLLHAENYFDVDSAQKYIIGARVWIDYDVGKSKGEAPTNPSRRIKTIRGFGRQLKAQEFILAEDGKEPKEVNVFDYLKEKYAKETKSLKETSISVNLGTAKGAMWYAPETLTILAFQPFRPKLSSALQDAMVHLACRTPDENKKGIMGEGLRCMGLLSPGQDSFINRAGINVEPKAVIVPCKTLGNVKIQPPAPKMNNGTWNMIDRKYESSSSCSRVFYIRCNPRFPITDFNKDFFNTLSGYLKVRINEPSCNHAQLSANLTLKDLEETLGKVSKWNPDLVIFLVPTKDSTANYALFKQLCDQKFGLKTVCMNAEKLFRMYSSRGKSEKAEKEWKGYVANVGMKVNMKLGGTNHLVKNLTEGGFGASVLQNTMILGADVTHPSPGSVEGTPSVAAVVGSVDAGFTKFLGSMRRQAPRGEKQSEEMIQEMKEMVKERLQAYKKRNKERYPDNIMYYRDGVSDSQYASVKRNELKAIREAYAEETKSDKTVKITAIITAKRHHTRLYPHEAQKSVRAIKSGNVLPGTMVDSTITSPTWFDFFIVTHNGIQGTSRPTHYFVLENQMGFKANELQDFTNKLCYTYVRSTSAVSYAPPAYYADRLCERGRVYLKRFFDGSLNVSAARQQDDETLRWETEEEAFHRCLEHDWMREEDRNNVDRKNPWHPNLDDIMFWM